MYEQAKVADRLEPKGKQSDNPLYCGVTRTKHCRRNGQNLTRSFVTYTKLGKPVSLLSSDR